MADEASKPQDASFPKPRVKLEKGVGSFFQRIQLFFKRDTPTTEIKLSGRIHELQNTSERVLIELLSFKHEVERYVDSHLFTILCNAIDPLIKEISSIQKLREHQNSATQQVKTFHRYVEWIEKAKKWSELKAHCQERQVLYQAALKHTIKEFQARIERDIQVIGDYLDHSINVFEGKNPSQIGLRDQLLHKLAPHLFLLTELKIPPENLTLETLTAWRNRADHSREASFSGALHVIDAFTEELVPNSFHVSPESESEHAVELLIKLNLLEDKIGEITFEIENGEEKDKKNLRVLLDKLDEEAHNLNCNLLLPHEFAERVQNATESLKHLRRSL